MTDSTTTSTTTPKKTETATYTHGHHPSVLASHTWRTAANSAAYILPYLTPTSHILDLGCGPGTITVDLATLVPQGRVVGVERDAGVLVQARKLAVEKGVEGRVRFFVGDGNSLAPPPPAAAAGGEGERGEGAEEGEEGEDDWTNTFDVVICHQVLQHVRDPAAILREMRRVCKPGGVVCARESDYAGFVWYPESAIMTSWRALYAQVARMNGGEPDAGRRLLRWAREAGFQRREVTCSSSNWCYSTEEEVRWWSGLWAERTVKSAFAEGAVKGGFVTREGLESMAEGWRAWGGSEDAWFAVLHGEVVCRKGESAE